MADVSAISSRIHA